MINLFKDFTGYMDIFIVRIYEGNASKGNASK
jgi:hypothetical protein